MQLSKTEEQLMEHIWQQEKIYFKDLMEYLPEPKPAPTTVATLLKRMQEKGVIAYEVHGNSRQYYPLISKTDYFARQVNGLIKNFFNNSAMQFASFFATNTNLTADELEELRQVVDQEITKKQKK
ncbi:BlaI/MecI/CopY family transcriptional regulator [Nibrella saemangeumensis]|uniref:BlaI/MecI/CopY family transcriptional regulator n=1 Tax=Nibrella saemangeumensis TaxID=1084526 RepID=A0ABP8N8R4_9BACT